MTTSRPNERPTAPGGGPTPRDPRGERGSVSMWVVLLAVALFSAAGLVIDGGYALSAKRRAITASEQAARVASDELSSAGLRNGAVVVNDSAARATAQSYLASIGATGTVHVSGNRVSVTVTADYDTTILSMVGVTTIPIRATSTATSIDAGQAP